MREKSPWARALLPLRNTSAPMETGDDGLTQYAVLRPEMSLEGLTEIFVVTSFDIVE